MNARRTKQTDQDNGANAMNMMTKIRGGAPTVISALGPACADWASVVDEYRGRRVDRESFADTFNAAEKAYFANKTESNEAKRRTSETAYKAASNKAQAAYERLAETPVSSLEQFLQKLEIIVDEEDAFHECNEFIGWLITVVKNDAVNLSRSYGAMALAPITALPAVAAKPATATAWMAAKASHATAGRAVSDYEAAVYEPAWNRFLKITGSVENWRGLTDAARAQLDTSGCDEAEERFDELVSERLESLRDMFATAAPDLDGVLHKLKCFQNEDAQDLVYAKDFIANLIEDVTRLNGGAA